MRLQMFKRQYDGLIIRSRDHCGGNGGHILVLMNAGAAALSCFLPRKRGSHKNSVGNNART